MIFTVPRLRGTDTQGSGAYGASRSGGRIHKGVDYVAQPGSRVYSAVSGVVKRLGYPYRNNRELRLIELELSDGALVRYMYVEPAVRKGDSVAVGDLLGTVQKLHYPGITQHVHVDVKVFPPGGQRRRFVNPTEYFKD